MARMPRASTRSDVPQPVFILGAPRSGTTLVEHVLSAHSAVRAGGEHAWLSELRTVAQSLCRYGGDFPGCLDATAAADERHLAAVLRDHYLARAEAAGLTGPGARFFTDKTPFNEINLPLLLMVFPGAKLVLVKRDPRDVAVSMLSNNLSHGFHCAFRFEDIVHHLAATEALLADYQRELSTRRTCCNTSGSWPTRKRRRVACSSTSACPSRMRACAFTRAGAMRRHRATRVSRRRSMTARWGAGDISRGSSRRTPRRSDPPFRPADTRREAAEPKHAEEYPGVGNFPSSCRPWRRPSCRRAIGLLPPRVLRQQQPARGVLAEHGGADRAERARSRRLAAARRIDCFPHAAQRDPHRMAIGARRQLGRADPVRQFPEPIPGLFRRNALLLGVFPRAHRGRRPAQRDAVRRARGPAGGDDARQLHRRRSRSRATRATCPPANGYRSAFRSRSCVRRPSTSSTPSACKASSFTSGARTEKSTC